MKRIKCIILFMYVCQCILGQNSNSRAGQIIDQKETFIIYKKLTGTADSLYVLKEYSKSVAYYSSAFKEWGDKGLAQHRYKAAIAYSSLSEKDSAFYQLIRVAKKTEYLNCDSLERKEFDVLKTDERWNHLKNILTGGSNVALASLLLKIRIDDQQGREGIDSIGKKFGFVSPEMNQRQAEISVKDSINRVKIDSIYSIYGWPDPELVGMKGSETVWLVIQHSPLSVQEKYFPIMQQAVKEGKANVKDLAYLEDRILMREGKPQKYGTQFIFKKDRVKHLYKLENSGKVNIMRDSVGLSPLTKPEISSIDTAQ